MQLLPKAHYCWRQSAMGDMVQFIDARDARRQVPQEHPWHASKRYELIDEYLSFRRTQGTSDLQQLIVQPAGEAQLLIGDLYDQATGTIFEAVVTTTREAVRQSIGKLQDLTRFVRDAGRQAGCAIIFANPPREDLARLLASVGIRYLYRNDADKSFVWNGAGTK